MDDKELDRVVDDQREWRKLLLKGQNKLFDTQKDIFIELNNQNTRIVKVELYQKLWNLAGASSLGAIVIWFKSHFK